MALDLEGATRRSVWYLDGTALTSIDPSAEEASVWVVPLDGGERRELATFEHGRVVYAAWNPTGDTLAVVTSQIFGDVVLVRGLRDGRTRRAHRARLRGGGS
jgi:Tol biopolymer transport system component